MQTDCGIKRQLWVMFVMFVLSVPAYADDRASFEQTYDKYQHYIDINETELALESMRDAYRYGARLFGKSSINTVNLAIEYARLLNGKNDFKAARKVLKGKDRILESRYGATGVELVPFLIQMGRAAKDPDTALGYLQRAASLSQGYEDDLMEAKKNFEILFILLARGGAALTEPYVERAFEIYDARLQASDVRLGLMAYHKARWTTSRGELDQSLGYLRRSLIAFEGQQPMGDLERGARVQLVQTLEKLGRSGEATQHLRAIGAATPWSTAAGPVYQSQANTFARLRESLGEGEVKLSFTVDENGFVVDPRITKSSSGLLSDAMLEMVRGFRYLPRFVDNHAVATPDVEYTESFANVVADAKGPNRFSRPGERGFMNSGMLDVSDCGSDTNNSPNCDRIGGGKSGK